MLFKYFRFTGFVEVVGSDSATTCQIVVLRHKGKHFSEADDYFSQSEIDFGFLSNHKRTLKYL